MSYCRIHKISKWQWNFKKNFFCYEMLFKTRRYIWCSCSSLRTEVLFCMNYIANCVDGDPRKFTFTLTSQYTDLFSESYWCQNLLNMKWKNVGMILQKLSNKDQFTEDRFKIVWKSRKGAPIPLCTEIQWFNGTQFSIGCLGQKEIIGALSRYY